MRRKKRIPARTLLSRLEDEVRVDRERFRSRLARKTARPAGQDGNANQSSEVGGLWRVFVLGEKTD